MSILGRRVISFLALANVFAQQTFVCDCVFVIHYLVKGGLHIACSAHYHRQSRGAWESQSGVKTKQDTEINCMRRERGGSETDSDYRITCTISALLHHTWTTHKPPQFQWPTWLRYGSKLESLSTHRFCWIKYMKICYSKILKRKEFTTKAVLIVFGQIKCHSSSLAQASIMSNLIFLLDHSSRHN